MSISNILRPKTLAEVTPYDLVVNSISTNELSFSNGLTTVFRAGAGYSVASGANTVMLYNSFEQDDPTGLHYDLVDGSFHVLKAGLYTISVNQVWEANVTGVRLHWVQFNDTRRGFICLDTSSTQSCGLYSSCTRQLSVGSIFSIYCNQNSGGALLALGALGGANEQYCSVSVYRESVSSSD